MDEDIISEILEEDEVSERELLEELAREEKLEQEQMLVNPPETQAMALSPFQETIVSTGSGVAYAILLVTKKFPFGNEQNQNSKNYILSKFRSLYQVQNLR